MYQFYLDDVLFPVAPSKLQLKISNKNKTATLINDGEINILKDAGLTDIEFTVLLPNVKYPFAIYDGDFKGAEYFLEKIEKFKIEKKPIRFIVLRRMKEGLFDTNIKVSLEDYTVTEDASKLGLDVEVSIKLKQYKDYCTKILTLKNKTTNTNSNALNTNNTTTQKVATITQNRTSNKVINKVHIVKQGETLWSICKKELGDGSKYKEVAEINNISNPNLIYVGQKIKLQ